MSAVLFVFASQAAEAKSNCQYQGPKGKVDAYYTGALIDTHLHIPSPIDSDNGNPVLRKDMTIGDIACTLAYEGTQTAFSFFPVYAGDADYEPFYRSADVAERAHPNRFFRFINPPGQRSGVPTVTAKKLKEFLNDRPDLFQGYGEIGLYVTPDNPDNAYSPTANIFQKIYTVTRKRNMPVYFHPGEDQQDDLAETLAENPDINFIVHGEQIENEIDGLMERYPNVYFTVNDLYGDQYLLNQNETADSFLEKIDDYDTLLAQDWSVWKARIEAHPEQYLWGTDRGGVAAWTLKKKVGYAISDYGRAFIAGLDPSVQEQFAYKNAQLLMQR